MVEEQVDVEVVLADLEVHLIADEGEADAKLEEEGAHVRDETSFQIALLRLVWEHEKSKT